MSYFQPHFQPFIGNKQLENSFPTDFPTFYCGRKSAGRKIFPTEQIKVVENYQPHFQPENLVGLATETIQLDFQPLLWPIKKQLEIFPTTCATRNKMVGNITNEICNTNTWLEFPRKLSGWCSNHFCNHFHSSWKYFQLFFQPYCWHRFQPFSKTVGKIELLNSLLFVKNSLKIVGNLSNNIPCPPIITQICYSNIIDLFNLMQNKYNIVQVQMTYHKKGTQIQCTTQIQEVYI